MDFPQIPDLPYIPDFDPSALVELPQFNDPDVLLRQLFSGDFHAIDEEPVLTRDQAALVGLLDELVSYVRPGDDGAANAGIIFLTSAVKSMRPEIARQLSTVDDEKIREVIRTISERASGLLEECQPDP